MFATFMDDRSYITYYIKINLTDRTYKTRSVYEEDLMHGSSCQDWDKSNIPLSINEVNDLFVSGLYDGHKGYMLLDISEE